MVKQKTLFGMMMVVLLAGSACTVLPKIPFTEYKFPNESAFIDDVKRPYEKLGLVRAKVNFRSLDPHREESLLCQNYYNKAVIDLVKMAKKRQADAVIGVRSVVFFADGKSEVYPTPECADDGFEGQILTQGVAVRWVN